MIVRDHRSRDWPPIMGVGSRGRPPQVRTGFSISTPRSQIAAWDGFPSLAPYSAVGDQQQEEEQYRAMDWTDFSCHDDFHLSTRVDEQIPFLDMALPGEDCSASATAAASEYPLRDDLSTWIQLGRFPGVSLLAPEERVDVQVTSSHGMGIPGERVFSDVNSSWLQWEEGTAAPPENEGCCCDDNHLCIGVDDLISFLDKSSPPAEDCPAAADTPALPLRNEWGASIQLGLPGGSLLTDEERADASCLLSQDVAPSRYDPADEGPPQYSGYPAALCGRNLQYGSSPDHRPLVYGPGQVPAEGAFSDVDGSRPVQWEEARTDSEAEPNDYMQLLNESSPECSPVSSPSHTLPLTLQAALEDVTQPVSEASPPDGLLAVQLLKHQKIALSWMIQKETCTGPCAGGILADDQGLGKTLSTIALIVTETPQRPTHEGWEEETVDFAVSHDDDMDDGKFHGLGPKIACRKRSRTSPTDDSSLLVPSLPRVRRPAGGTLVVCPTSVLRQWADELRNRVTPKANLSFLVYYGPNRTSDPKELAKYDVVLTTYHIVSMEVPKEVLGDGDEKINDDEDWLDGYGPIPRHDACSPPSTKKRRRKKKNPRGREEEAAAARPLAMVAWFRVVLDEAQTIKNHKTLAARACSRLVAKRRWCLSGTPIQNSINDLYSYFRFLRHETYSVISSFRYDIRLPIERKMGNSAHGYQKLQEVLKVVLLRRTKDTLIEGQPVVNLPPKSLEMKALDFCEEERAFYNNLESASRERFKEYQDNGTVKQNFVNILQLLLRLRQACNHPALTPAVYESSSSPSTIQIPAENVERLGKDKCLDLLKCMAASQAICAVCSDPPEDAVVSVCGHVFCNQCLLERLSRDDAEEKTCSKPGCKTKLSAATVFTKASLQSCIGDVQLAPETSLAEAFPTVNSSEEKPGIIHADSSKIKAAMEMLLSLPTLEHSSSSGYEGLTAAGHTTEKALVFSQWTKMLDLLENKLRTSSIRYRRLDGTMPIADRDKAVKEFNTQPEVTVMLMSLKAASVGLNMVAANHVLLLDPWWNPTTEDQAIDRAHRIGQKRPVNVTRFTVKDTVEDRIMNLQETKRRLVASAFGEVGRGSRQSKLTVDDLSYLFKA